MANLKQATDLVAKSDFTMKVPGAKGRPVNVKTGDRFWVTSVAINNTHHVMIDRRGKGSAGSGWAINLSNLYQLFTVGS